MISEHILMDEGKQKELAVAFYLAPVVLGVKPASLLAFWSVELKEYEAVTSRLGIQSVILDEYHGKSYVLFYDRELLLRTMESSGSKEVLKIFGYDGMELEPLIHRVSLRLQKCHRRKEAEFPHEIGIMLGYPHLDVLGYIKHHGKEALYDGYWKVYDDVAKAKEIFLQYDIAKKVLLQYVITHSLHEKKVERQ